MSSGALTSDAQGEQTLAHLVVDREACAGHGLCYSADPELLDSDDVGNPVVLVDPVPTSLRSRATAVIRVCPERALTLSTG